MPDRLCKVCYDCEQPFTVIRRRHHCRMCGQVFCHSCSPYVVDGRALGELGSVRACKLCHDQQAESSVDALAHNRRRAPLTFSKTTSTTSSSKLPSSVSSKAGAPSATDKIGRSAGSSTPASSSNSPKGGGSRNGAAGSGVPAAAVASAIPGAAAGPTTLSAVGPSPSDDNGDEAGEESDSVDLSTPSSSRFGGSPRNLNQSVDLGEGALGTAVREPGSAEPSLAGLASLAEMNLQQQFDVVSPAGAPNSNTGRGNTRNRAGSSGGNSAELGAGTSGKRGLNSSNDTDSGNASGLDEGGASSGSEGVPKRRGPANPLLLMSKMAGAALSGSERLLTGGGGSSSGAAGVGSGTGVFVAAKTFQGPKPGFEFKQGARGMGYYLTVLPAVTAPLALQVGKEAKEEAARTAAGHVLARSEQPCLLERPHSLLNFGDMMGSGSHNSHTSGSGNATLGSPTSAASDNGGHGGSSSGNTTSGGRNAESYAASEMHQGLLSAAANEHFERLVRFTKCCARTLFFFLYC